MTNEYGAPVPHSPGETTGSDQPVPTCQRCDRPLPRRRRRFCSPNCCQKWHDDRREDPRTPSSCKQCGAGFMALVARVRAGAGVFCSKTCEAGHARATGSRAGANNPRWKGGTSGITLEQRRARDARWPERVAARRAVARALESGRLKRKPCACGELRSEAHHDDYSKPLKVRWLCRSCHAKEHAHATPPHPER